MTAEQVLNAIKKAECFEIDYSGMTEDEVYELDNAIDLVFKAAKTWATQPQGSWNVTEHTFEQLDGTVETYTRVTCSVCNQANGWGEVPFCPWCGTSMRAKT